MTETPAVRIMGFCCKFRCKSDPRKRRTFTLKMHMCFGTWKNDPVIRELIKRILLYCQACKSNAKLNSEILMLIENFVDFTYVFILFSKF